MSIDYNEDGKINIKDITAAIEDLKKVQMFGFELMKPLVYNSANSNNPILDLNKDNKVNILDITSFLHEVNECIEFLTNLFVLCQYRNSAEESEENN